MSSVPLLIPGLQPLRAASDQYIWAVLHTMKASGQMTDQLPDYEEIERQLARAGFPPYTNKQISKSVVRLKSLRYIRESVELAA